MFPCVLLDLCCQFLSIHIDHRHASELSRAPRVSFNTCLLWHETVTHTHLSILSVWLDISIVWALHRGYVNQEVIILFVGPVLLLYTQSEHRDQCVQSVSHHSLGKFSASLSAFSWLLISCRPEDLIKIYSQRKYTPNTLPVLYCIGYKDVMKQWWLYSWGNDSCVLMKSNTSIKFKKIWNYLLWLKTFPFPSLTYSLVSLWCLQTINTRDCFSVIWRWLFECVSNFFEWLQLHVLFQTINLAILWNFKPKMDGHLSDVRCCHLCVHKFELFICATFFTNKELKLFF